MKKALFKDTIKQIIKTNKRFISILLMAFLGVGFFAGVKASSPDMKKTLDSFLDKYNVYDLKLVSTLGLTNDDVNAISNLNGVNKAYGTFSKDVFLTIDETENVVKVFSIENEFNKLELIEGNMPQNSDECVVEYTLKSNISIGDYLEIREDLKEDEESSFYNTKIKVVGFVRSPLYISRDRGTTNLGSGKLSYYVYVDKSNINADLFTEIYILAEGAKQLESVSNEYDNLIKNIETNIDNIKEERQNLRYNELVTEANSKLNDAQNEFNKQKSEAEQKIADAEKEISDAKKEIADGEKKITDSEKELQNGKDTADVEFKNAEAQISAAETQLAISQTEIDDSKALLSAKKQEAESGKAQIQTGLETVNNTINDLSQNKSLAESVLSGIAKIDETLLMLNSTLVADQQQLETVTGDTTELVQMIEYIKLQIEQLNSQKQELLSHNITQETIAQIDAGLAKCNQQKSELESQLAKIDEEIKSAEDQIADGQNKIAAGWEQIAVSKSQLAEKKNETAQKFVDAEKEIANGKKDIEKAKKELADGEKELEEKKAEFNTKISDAESKIIDAREKVNDIETAKWYIFDRNDNSGFNSYFQDSGNVEKLGDVFPVVFFVIATLISLTTMSRMVEEERVQIGTLKALGYNKLQIMSKYIIYSLLASIIGGYLGAVFGLNFLPNVIMSMYQMMYDMPEIVVEFNTQLAVLGMSIMTVCIVGATIYTANKELTNTPAEMMRPKAPKAGKRVLIEKIPFIWNRFSFTQKVTLRNMFRYKKRFLMTVIGIAGCTALILAGFGLKDSVSKIMDYQYIDIYDYDMMIGLKNTLSIDEINSLKNELEAKEEIEKCTELYMLSHDIKNGNLEEETQIVVTDNNENLNRVIRLKDHKTGETLELNDEEVIITDKLSQLINAKVGDEVIITDSDKNEYKVKIGGITEHYISHYIYMTSNLYNKIFNETAKNNVLLVQYSGEINNEVENKLSEEILQNSKVASLTLTSYLMAIMDDTLSALNYVVYILIISAGLLAFIVLYNLANINISERIRELATIKVLGFYDKEVFDYITREIVLLTFIGIICGLVFGYFLNQFILGTCEINILRFKRIILPESYLFSTLITIVFTIIVNFITYFSLKKVDMIESLKSVE